VSLQPGSTNGDIIGPLTIVYIPSFTTGDTAAATTGQVRLDPEEF